MPQSIRLLYVDNDEDSLKSVSEALKRRGEGVSVIATTGIQEALGKLESNDISCVVSDHRPPELNGLNLLRRVRNNHPSIPFILFTNQGNEKVASQAISYGVTEYIRKNEVENPYIALSDRIKEVVFEHRSGMGFERFFEAIESSRDGISLLDSDGRFTYVNQAYADIYGYEPEEMVGEHWEILYREDDVEEINEEILPRTREEGTWRGETIGVRKDGTTLIEDHTIVHTDGGLICCVRDITDERERKLELKEEKDLTRGVLNALNDIFYVFDETGKFIRWNERLNEVTGYTDEEIKSMSPIDFISEKDSEEVAEAIQEILNKDVTRTVESAVVTKGGEEIPYEFSGSLLKNRNGDAIGVAGTGRDITERKRREGELSRYEKLVETSRDAMFALGPDMRFTLVNKSIEEITGLDRNEIIGEHASVMLENGVVDDKDFDKAMGIIEGLRSSDKDYDRFELTLNTTDGEIEAEYNISTFPGVDTQDDSGVIGVIRDISERKRQNERIRKQKKELERLDRINRTIREINRTLVRSPSREETEERVCEKLIESNQYASAWIGEHDVEKGTVVPSSWAGVGEDYIQAVSADNDIADVRIAEEAVETGEIQVVQLIPETPSYGPWREEILDYGWQSWAAIPIDYEDTVYGVLNLCANHSFAFDKREQEVLAELGETIGLAINSLERKEALMSDSVTKLELRFEDIVDDLTGDASKHTGATITVERTIPTRDNSFLQYVILEGISEDGHEFVSDLVDADHVRLLSEEQDMSLFEIRHSDAHIVSTITSHGGRVRRMKIEDGDIYLVSYLPQNTDVSEVISSIKSLYPDTELTTQRTITSSYETIQEQREDVKARLTEKQLSALEAAYFSGYLDYPRNSTGEEVADSLNISQSTFRQHLNAGLNKTLRVLLDDEGKRL